MSGVHSLVFDKGPELQVAGNVGVVNEEISKILGVAYFETSTEVDSNYLIHMSWI